jgi:hypothetical protein
VLLHELDQLRQEKAASFRANGASEAFILRLLLQPTTRKPAWEEAAEDLLMEYGGEWMTVPDDELERRGVTRGQLLAKVIDSGGPGSVTYTKIVSFPVPKESPRTMLAPVIHIQTASRVRRMVPRSRRRRTTATRRGPPSDDPSRDLDRSHGAGGLAGAKAAKGALNAMKVQSHIRRASLPGGAR